MRSIAALIIVVAISAFAHRSVSAADLNFPDAKAATISDNPYVEISEFRFTNDVPDGARRLVSWKNIGTSRVAAFEVRVLRFDPFNRPLPPIAWTFAGTNTSFWSGLDPGNDGQASTNSRSINEALSEVAYVSFVRLKDGQIWRADLAKVHAKVRALIPGIRDVLDAELTKEEPKKR